MIMLVVMPVSIVNTISGIEYKACEDWRNISLLTTVPTYCTDCNPVNSLLTHWSWGKHNRQTVLLSLFCRKGLHLWLLPFRLLEAGVCRWLDLWLLPFCLLETGVCSWFVDLSHKCLSEVGLWRQQLLCFCRARKACFGELTAIV